MKAKSKPGKSRASRSRSRKVRRKSINTAVLPVAVNSSADAGKAVISIASAPGRDANDVVPVAVRHSSGDVVIPAMVNGRGRRQRSVQIRVAVKKRARKQNLDKRAQDRAHKDEAQPLVRYQRDPVTNLVTSGTYIEENAVNLVGQAGTNAIDLIQHLSRILLNRGLRMSRATEQVIEPAIRMVQPSRPRRNVKRIRVVRRREGIRIAA